MRRNQYEIEVEAEPITVHLNDFYDDTVVDYVENVLGYSVTEKIPPKNVLDEVAEQLKEEFLEGLDFHQLNTLVKSKKEVIEYIRQLKVASEK
jgi:hypothetical protein